MPLFQIDDKKLTLMKPTNFGMEKDLQQLIETNLTTVFDCRFVASEFPTGAEHAGRIDSLALSEDSNPVIIEYKKVESSELINQSLYYLSWINDHRGDFEIAVHKALGNTTKVDWSDVRVICIAPGYKKFDLHAVKVMGANIELWQYRLFDNGALYFEEIFRKSTSLIGDVGVLSDGKNPIMVAAGKKAAATRASGSYTVEQHLEDIDEEIKEIAVELREQILNIGESVEESPKKFYIAYKVAQNFVCLETNKKKITLFLKLNPSELGKLPVNGRDVTGIGHQGTGDFELTVRSKDEIEEAIKFIRRAFERVGG
ncbi:DUF5655 domain-containing protein [Bdellovibrionota bacterium FG-1]